MWHVPNDKEIEYALELFDTLVASTLDSLEGLLKDGVVRDAVWRNDFCRYLSFVKEAFSGVASLAKEEATPEEREEYLRTTDLPYVNPLCCLNQASDEGLHRESLPEMVASGAGVACGYPLNDDNDPRRQKLMKYRRRFANFLISASRVLRQQGEENTVDAILMLVR